MNNKIIKDKTTHEFISNLTLLCVEDNKTTQILYESIFEDLVKDIIFADDGNDGYDKFLANNVDIIFTDYDMPNLNGIEMIQRIRSVNEDIPILLVSAIYDVDIVVKALNYNVNNFLKKPINSDDMLIGLEKVVKLLIANKFLKNERKKELEKYKKHEEYTSYQEELAFAKELNILRNDFYYQMIVNKKISLVDFLYSPLDVVSGDAYSARRINDTTTFYLIVDGMGKGLSASLSAMIMTAFVNHMVDKMLEYQSFSFDILIRESLDYIKPVLLDEEALALDFILMDTYFHTLRYSKFAMPVFLLQNNDGEIIKLKSNNPPLSKWQPSYKIDECDISNIEKFLFYSDGIAENTLKNEDKVYADYIESDFKDSFTREDLKEKIYDKIAEQEDDLTLIFINTLNYTQKLENKVFETSLQDVEDANEWYSEVWNDLTSDIKISNGANVVFTELFMNAYEHGNLGINTAQKQNMLEDDTYLSTLLELEQDCDKKIFVEINKILHNDFTYIVTQITDEGVGFDTMILADIFRNSASFNGRGVFVSRKNSLGIYYNTSGNSVLYISKI
jgi:YesN/AraC family two-component response regulator